MAVLTKLHKSNDLESTNSLGLGLPIFEVFIRILLLVNLYLNQILNILALCKRNFQNSFNSSNSQGFSYPYTWPCIL